MFPFSYLYFLCYVLCWDSHIWCYFMFYFSISCFVSYILSVEIFAMFKWDFGV